MKKHCFAWYARLLAAALTAAFLLSGSPAPSQAAPPGSEDPAPPSRKAADEDPPLPSKKSAPAKQTRVRVTAPSAEVQTGDQVVATVKRGQLLPFTKKNDDYYLVIVDGKKGWIKKEAVREVAPGEAEAPAAEIPPGPAPAVIDKDTAHKVKQATAYLRVRLASGNTVEGSGFFAVQPGLVLTNAHVLGMLSPASPLPAEVRVVVHSGEPEEFAVPAEVLGVDRDNDLGVLLVKRRADRLPAPLPVDTSRALALVQKVYIFGFPFGASLGKDITASESSVSSIRKDAGGAATQIQVNGGMHPGNSGGPVVDSRGVVVGVAVSKISGTQINFAVPGEKVRELLRGRASRTQLGEAFRDKDQVRLPVRVSCLDPLERIRTVKLETWAGKPTPVRPAATTEPAQLPGDGPRRAVTIRYQEGVAQADVAIPALEAGQVMWVRPVLTDAAGATHWARALAYSPSDLPPLERRAALLQPSFERHEQRTLSLTGSFKAQVVSKTARQTLLRDSMEIEMLETARTEPRGGRLDLFLGTYSFTTAEGKEEPRPLNPQAQTFLRDRSFTFIVDPQGALLQRTAPVLRPPIRPDLRADFAELVHLIANCYEMTCLGVPERRVEAQDTWQVRMPLFLSYADKKEIVDLVLTCTYEGRRRHRGQNEAVISLAGTIKGRPPGRQTTAGTVEGKAYFAIDDGFVSRASIRVESQGGDEGSTVAHSLEVSLTRVAGNRAGIVARAVGPVPGAPPTTGTDYEQAAAHLKKRDFDQAIPLLEKAVAANPNFVKAQADLGFAYNEKGQWDKAIPCLKKVLELEPGHVIARHNLGAAYNAKGLYDDAIACYKKVIEQDPDSAVAHSNLGVAYNGKRMHNEAIASFKRAIEIAPRQVSPHMGLGFAYNARGLYDEAIGCFRKVLALDPNVATAHNNIGVALNGKGLYDQGIPELKKAAELDPKNLIALDNLAGPLAEVGDLRQACDVLKKALERTPEGSPQHRARKQSLEQMEALLRLEPRLADILKGEPKPKGFQEGCRFGKLCRLKGHYLAASRFYEQACADDPEAARKLAAANLVIMARGAALASAGRGKDAPPEAERSKYRARALAWLQRFVKAQQEALEKNFKANRYVCERGLRELLQHKDLATLRPPALGDLPAAERKEWDRLWNEVDALIEKADALPPDPPAENP